jgi:hypothetical protein
VEVQQAFLIAACGLFVLGAALATWVCLRATDASEPEDLRERVLRFAVPWSGRKFLRERLVFGVPLLAAAFAVFCLGWGFNEYRKWGTPVAEDYKDTQPGSNFLIFEEYNPEGDANFMQLLTSKAYDSRVFEGTFFPEGIPGGKEKPRKTVGASIIALRSEATGIRAALRAPGARLRGPALAGDEGGQLHDLFMSQAYFDEVTSWERNPFAFGARWAPVLAWYFGVPFLLAMLGIWGVRAAILHMSQRMRRNELLRRMRAHPWHKGESAKFEPASPWRRWIFGRPDLFKATPQDGGPPAWVDLRPRSDTPEFELLRLPGRPALAVPAGVGRRLETLRQG